MNKSILDKPAGLIFQGVFLALWTGAALDVVPPVLPLIMLVLIVGETVQSVREYG